MRRGIGTFVDMYMLTDQAVDKRQLLKHKEYNGGHNMEQNVKKETLL